MRVSCPWGQPWSRKPPPQPTVTARWVGRVGHSHKGSVPACDVEGVQAWCGLPVVLGFTAHSALQGSQSRRGVVTGWGQLGRQAGTSCLLPRPRGLGQDGQCLRLC